MKSIFLNGTRAAILPPAAHNPHEKADYHQMAVGLGALLRPRIRLEVETSNYVQLLVEVILQGVLQGIRATDRKRDCKILGC